MKIGISYIDGSNLGDQIIYETARFLLEKCLQDNGITDYEIVPVDICLVKNGKHTGTGKGGLLSDTKNQGGNVLDQLSSHGRTFLNKGIRYINRRIPPSFSEKTKRSILRRTWHMSPTYADFKRTQRSKFDDMDMMFFLGGGIIKYHAQNFHNILDEVTALCERKKIPVSIHAAGVEGFDGNEPNCQLLMRALNRSCVRYISVRDDYETLVKHYVRNKNIRTELVCDPAFWSVECYGIQKSSEGKKVVGLNAIRPPIWEKYLYRIDHAKLVAMYHDLTAKLLDDGYHVEYFTNGVEADGKVFDMLFAQYKDIAAAREQGRITLFRPSGTKEFIARLSGYERFMAVRFHGSIIGTCLGIPNISLVWNVKQLLFGKIAGVPDNFITKKDFAADKVYDRLIHAEPVQLDPAYKMSIYKGLDGQIKSFCRS